MFVLQLIFIAAPEALQYHVYSVESDVFAFGIVVWEISTLGTLKFNL